MVKNLEGEIITLATRGLIFAGAATNPEPTVHRSAWCGPRCHRVLPSIPVVTVFWIVLSLCAPFDFLLCLDPVDWSGLVVVARQFQSHGGRFVLRLRLSEPEQPVATLQRLSSER
ncbi:hypothetical protein NDU88_009413 [Pleurodeles waltl]|uniref:Uncharacterized protein n=1 Tax=Pleurodeles waltl TaxID=8319 RepID=A0AAV7QUI8_PLEWA|nr:hypothetical protein NDU88_009413 [Pleurodeles waltl]